MKKIKLLLVAGACVVLSACSPQAPTVHTTDKGTHGSGTRELLL